MTRNQPMSVSKLSTFYTPESQAVTTLILNCHTIININQIGFIFYCMFVLYGHFDRIGYMLAAFVGPLSVIGSLSLLLLLSHCRPTQRNCMHDYWHMRRTDVPGLGLLFELFAEWPAVNRRIGVVRMMMSCYWTPLAAMMMMMGVLMHVVHCQPTRRNCTVCYWHMRRRRDPC